jgi:ubiquitin-protein ligase
MLSRRLNQEIKELENSPILNCTAGPNNPDDLTKWTGTIFGPDNTPYQGGIFNIKIQFTEEYPFKPPSISFITKIYHCNINERGNICLDILHKNWSPALTIGKVLISISSLLADPNPDDPLVQNIADLLKTNKLLHDFNAKEYTFKYANV